jgi:murein DD-endopeptidase MepM/ murein hydrolase activator NlpD
MTVRTLARALARTLAVSTLLLGAPSAGVAQDGMRWRPPVTPVTVLRHFDPPEQRWLPGHRGVDLRTTPGAGVRAAGDGRVTFAGTLAGRGVVTVDHGELRTTYEPVDALVLVGERVRAGETIGTTGTGTGHCGSGRCLHLGLRRGREYLDPMLLLGRSSARLRPW